MSFLAPWALLFGALVAVPLLVHLRRRRATRRVPFPAIRYLSAAREASARSLRAADLRLLAVRVAFLLCLVLAAAGPLVGRGDPEDHGPTDLALVIDNTASAGRVAGDSVLLALLVQRAHQAVAAAGPGDRFWVLPVVGGPLAAGLPPGASAEALARVPATDGGGDPRAAVAAAAAALPEAEGRNREVVLLGDLQASALRSETTRSPGTGEVPRLLVFRPPRVEAANGAVVAASLESGSVWPTGIAPSLVAETRRYAEGDAEAGDAPDSVSVRLEVDGRAAGAAAAPWGGTASFRLPDLPPGAHHGRVSVEPDGLRADDARHLAFQVVPPPAVRHVGPADGFLAAALETLRADGRIGEADAGGSGVGLVRVVEADGRPLPADPSGVGASEPGGPGPAGGARGGAIATLLVPPPDAVGLPAFNQLLEREGLPWRLRPDSLPGQLDLAGGAGVPGLAGERVGRRYLPVGASSSAAGDPAGDPTDDPAAEVLLATADGAPWLLRRRAGRHTHLLLLSPLLPGATTVATSPAMIPFVEALLLRWTRLGEPTGDRARAGAPVTLPAWTDSVRTPDGQTVAVEGGAPFVPLRAGVYALFGGAATEPARATAAPAGGAGSAETGGPAPAAYLAANVPPEESDPRRLEPSRLQELFPGREVDIAGPDPDAWRRALYGDRRGAAVSPWLLGLALGLAALEAALAAPGRKRDRAA